MRVSSHALVLVCLVFPFTSLFADDYLGSVEFSLDDLRIEQINGFDYVHLTDGVPYAPVGAPALPQCQMDVAIPWDTEVAGVTVVRVETLEIEGDFNVVPMMAPVKVSGENGAPTFFQDPMVYSQNAPYPGVYLVHLGTWDLVGQRFAKLGFFPLQYNPVTKKLALVTKIEFRLFLDPVVNPKEQPAFNLTEQGRNYYEEMLLKNALNPENVSLQPFGGGTGRALPAGQYEHVIITPETFESDWDALVTWHTLKGLPDIVVTKEYILASYTGTDQEKIRAFVVDAHTTWGTRYFLIGADGGTAADQVPYHDRFLLSENVPNDTFYADYDDDWVAEVHVGRASVTSTTEIGAFIDKVLYYEKTPPATDYAENTLFLGFDLDASTPGENTKVLVYGNDIPAHINLSTEYDSEVGAHLMDVIAYLNAGPNLVNHIDHCNWDVWGMGYTNHSESMYAADASALTNGMRLINFYTLGCFASAWDYSLSLSETFMRKTGGGGVSFTGNTRNGWYVAGYDDLYSSLYDMRWWHVLFTDNQYHVGEALTAHKNDYFPTDETYQYIFTELNLLGDPAMPLWKNDPAGLVVNHDSPLYTGSQGYSVNVQDGGGDLPGALVCLWKGSEVYVFNTTDASGNTSFAIDPVTPGTLYVTATAQDALPYESQVTVYDDTPPSVTSITPDCGAAIGGTSVTIDGFNFVPSDTTVDFDGLPATNVVVVDLNTITCDAPAHADGTVDLVVTTGAGSDTLAGGFTFHDPPVISAILPGEGAANGTTPVAITGNNFTTVCPMNVDFGGQSALNLVVVDSENITCEVPAQRAGSVDVEVANPYGNDILPGGFTYRAPPTITGITPSDGPIAGGTSVTITGANYSSVIDTSITFGGVLATNLVVVNSTTMTCDTPAHAAGAVDVVVTNRFGTVTETGGFTYHNAPGVTSLSPDNGPVTGGQSVTITGTDFSSVGTTTVTFGGTSATSVVVVNTTTITCDTPAHAGGVVDVAVTNDFGSDTLVGGYTYNFEPTVSGIIPSDGPIAGGTSVTITGNYFTTTPDTTVTFDGTSATNVTVVNVNAITCTTPAHAAGAVDVVVTNSNGSGTLASGFTYHNAPGVTSVSPDNGPPAGGTSVTITGTDFTAVGTTTVTLGGTSATSVVVVNATTLTCDTPAHASGAVDLVVTNDFGSDTLVNGFTYNNAPALSGISPADGAIAGGTSVTITGTDFTTTPDTTVTFDGTAATSVAVVNTTTLTCDTPAHAAGAVDVVVTNSNGTGTLPSGFTYHNVPGVTSLSPDNGPMAGGTSVTITGTDFTTVGTTTVTFGGASATSVVVVNATTVTCDTPAHAAGLVDVVVTNDFGSDTLAGSYTYNNAPAVSSVAPTDGPIAGGTSVTITGNYFTTTPDTTVTFGGTAATGVVVVDVNTITCTTPAHTAGAADVVVTNSNGSGTLAGGFTFHNAPSITSLSPDNGPMTGGTSVTITGNDFTTVGVTTVTFDGLAATGIVVVNTTTITCNTPAHAAGSVDVVVTDDFGTDTLTGGYTYNNAPTVSSVSPTDGSSAGGTSVTITGNYFTTTPDTTVTFGGSAATNVSVVNATTLTCDTPAHAAGTVDVVVTNSNGTGTLTSGFTYHNPPAITSLSPDNGPIAGGTPVTITGTDFSTIGSTSVTFGGTSAVSVVVVNATTITCTTPAHAAGQVDVVVTNDFGSDTLVNGFFFNNAPQVSSINPTDGPIAGGTSVTISGAAFTTTPDTTVTFGGTAATSVVVVDVNTITCSTPAHVAGLVDVVVTNSNGSGTLASGFTYHNPPTLTSVAPANGPPVGGTAVTVTGTNFTTVGTTTVTFGGNTATNITVVNVTTITCDTPAHAAGAVDVAVTNDFGSDTLVSGFTYNGPPTVTSATPADGPVAGGTSVTIAGTGFTTVPDTTVTFGGTAAANLVVVNENTMTCDTPAHAAGQVDVVVTNSNGTGTLTNGFTYHNPPTLMTVTPSSGTPLGGTSVTLTGTGFTPVGITSVLFGGSAATNIVIVNSTTLTCDTPAHASGLIDVVLTNDFGSDTLTGGFTFNSAPTVSGVIPADGPVAGGTSVSITGTGFTTTPDTAVTFGGTAATGVSVVNATTITCTTPVHAAGAVDVVVTNSNGNGTLPGGYTYHNPPSLGSITPDNGPIAGGTSVTITGADFTSVGATTVALDGTAATNLVVVNATTITCDTPGHAAGLVDVVLTNDFGSDTLTGGYTYNEPPTVSSVAPADGPVAGGTSVTITGSFFTTTPDTTVTFGGTAATSVAVVNATTITCDAPAHAAGLVDVVVTNANGPGTLPSGFTYHNAPSITSVAPINGPPAGGTSVTITGTDFTTVGTTTVSFDASAATSVVVVNATTITCTTPAHASGAVDVVVTNDFGTDTLVGGYTFNSGPSVSSVAPADGPVAGGTSVTITGAGFTSTPDTTVTIGGTAVSNMAVVNATTITCDTPAHAAGSVDVVVTNTNGTGTLPGGFTYHNAPDITSLTPNNGPPLGGTAVTITGTDFTSVGTTVITFNGNVAANVAVVNATTITCDTPSHAAGLVDVVVTNNFGTDTLTGGFTFNSPPTISGVSPADGPVAGGTSVTITGSNFTTTPDTTVTFGGTPATSVAVVNATTITCATPAHAAGLVDVVVTNANGSGTLPSAFTYHSAPSITSVAPSNGPPAGGTAVTITGTDFTTVGTTTVSFDGSAATSVVVVNATTITCTTPAHASGAVDVVVTNDYGTDTLAGGYSYNSAPSVASVAPADGPVAGGTSVTITGTGYTTTPDTTVTFGGTAALNIVVVNATTITCDTPAHAAGASDVVVTNTNGTGTLTGGFTYHNPPGVTSLNPSSGSTLGGTPVTITGTDFTTVGTTTVTFDGISASSVVVVNATTITCTTAAHAAGAVDVVVTNDFGSDTLAGGYTYNNPPSVSSIAPADGPIAGGTSVTITGTGFTTTPDTTVTFGGSAATSVAVVNATTITCATPAHAAGSVDVVVTNSNGPGTLPSAFTYHNAPDISSVAPNNGTPLGGTAVTITGTDFTTVGATAVTFDGTSATSVVVVNATTITCDTPAHVSGVVDVIVTNDFGSDSLINGFTYNSAPTVSLAAPSNGPVAGGTPVTITGNYFTTTPDTTVTFGGASAASVVVVNATTITCDTPAHAAGSVDVVVTNSNGTGTLPAGFTYHNPPALGSLAPTNGSPLGGTAVTLTGTGFTTVGTTTVSFGGTAASGVVVVNATTINCDTPAHASGLVDVVLTNDFGSDTLTGGFTFNNAPTVSSVIPTDGPAAGGTAVTITGTGFTTTPDTTVTFGGTAASGVVVVNTTTITCDTPAHAAGSVDVTVTNSNGTGTLPGGFTYHNPPALSSLAPTNGTPLGGTAVTLTGTDFTTVGTTTVSFDGSAASSVVVVNATTITCDTPPHASGVVDVIVTNDFGSDTLINGFTYNSAPTVSLVAPSNGPVAGGTPVTITGNYFTTAPDTTVTFGGVAAMNVVVVDVATITCNTPAHAAGSVDVTVTNSNGTGTLAGGFAYHNPPALSSLAPTNGSPLGGTAVTLTGTDFTTVGATTVSFGGTAAANVVVVNATTITCDSPAHASGAVDVVVTNDFGSDTLAGGFTYNDSPLVSSVTPADGPVAGGTSVTITGSNFTTTVDTTVTFGGASATNMVVVNATTITCDTPAHAAGAVDVAVTNSNGPGTLPAGFTYHNPPAIVSVIPGNGPQSGGAAVTISGTDFTTVGATTVTFDGLSATNLLVVNATTITCDTPAHAAGSVDVTVTNDFGADTLVGGFSYNNAPSVAGVTPADGPIAGGTPVTITGGAFTTTPDTTVTFGGTAATGVVVVDVNTITCTTPAHAAGSVDVVVTNSNGTGTLPAGFTYHNPPDLISVAPGNGPPAGGTAVTITGTDFTPVGTTTVSFDGLNATNIVVVNATTITCDTPAHASGAVDVAVTNDFGGDTLVNGFIYDNPPTLSGISPADGPVAGGTGVTITGNYFTTTPDTSVTLGGAAATNLVVVDVNTITCDTPAHAAGVTDVVVTNSNGTDTLPSGFTYHNPPSLTSIAPVNGPPSGGTAVTLTGTDFTTVGTSTVTFGAAAATNVVVVNATTITCDTPAHVSGAVDVVVTNDFGSDSLVGGFTYNDGPVVSSVTPSDGPIAGGTAVTITGDFFTTTPDTTVTFGGASATNVAVVDVNTITCDAPAHAAGAVDVAVTNTNGTGTLPSGFTYHSAPSITSVAPSNGPPSGGTPVTITGTDFTPVGTTTVTFNGNAATSVAVVNATTITCTTPAHTTGLVDVTVTNDFGTDTLTGGFSFNNAPVISSVIPSHGPIAGATAVTITGDFFTTTPDTTVTFGGTAATNVAVVDVNTITCDTPAHAAGAVDVIVNNSNGSGTSPGAFTYHNPPSITSIAPDNGTPAGGTGVTLTGRDFTTVGATTVAFDGLAATNVVVVDSVTITCDTPAHAPGPVDVVVTDDFGSDTLVGGFTYNNPPSLSGVSPADGPVAGGTAVTITGSAFTTTPDTTVTIGGAAAVNMAVVNATTITCDTPAHAAGAVDIVVMNTNGTATLPGGFTYHNAPTIATVAPNSGPPAGGTNVTVTGTDFTPVGTTSVTFDGTAATNVVVVNALTITCDTPAHIPGIVDVTVTNDFGADTLASGFTYNNAPSVASVTPSNGPIAGGTAVTIAGSAFTTTPDTTVTFGGTAATNVAVVNATTLTCDTPAHAAGLVDVMVTNSNGTGTLPSGFTYHNPPSIVSVTPNTGTSPGGTPVTISGSDFTTVGVTSVAFNGDAGVNVVVVNASTITCDTPPHAVGPVDVTVTNDFGADTLTGGFTFIEPPPTVSSIIPADGPVVGGTAVTITGDDFTTSPDTTVTFGGATASSVVVVDVNTITCTSPAHASGIVDVVVTNSNGSGTLAAGFTYHNPPSIALVIPNNGPMAGGTAVTLTGNDFTAVGATTVTFDGTSATSIVVVNATTITCETPAHAAGAVDVTVTNDFGTDTLVGGFNYNNAPSVSSVAPADGQVAGGTAVTLTGSAFTTTPDTTVTFDGTAATNMVVVNATTITCDTPAHAAGTVDIVVTNSNGFGTLPAAFTYHNPPTLTGVAPVSGPFTGGTAVTLTGSEFTTVGPTTVIFGGTAATNVVVVNATTITCDTPPHASGAVDVVVTNDFGSDTLAGGYTYTELPPEVTGIAPTDGPIAGGTAVTLTGDYFTTTPDTTVGFGGAFATNVVVVNANTITCTTPAHAAGAVHVVVTNSNGSGSLLDGFTFHNPPSINSVTPGTGPVAGGTPVTIIGSDFSLIGPSTVTFGGTSALNIVIVSSTTITCDTPANAVGPADVAVTNDFGSDTLVGGFTYHNAPSITGIAPPHGAVAGGTAVTISGGGYTTSPDTTVTFDGLLATNVVVVNASTITCDTPAHATSTVDVTVTNSNGSDTLAGGFTYYNAPNIFSVDPDKGPAIGGQSVVISGVDFASVGFTTVTFGGASATNLVVVNATTITCDTPALVVGPVDVVVTNDFGSDTLTNGYTYVNEPLVTGIAPAHGPVAGGTAVTITGDYFTSTADTTVSIGGTTALNVVVLNNTTITCTTPAHAAGASDVSVMTSNGTGTLPGGFTFHNPPSIGLVIPDNGSSSGGTSVTISGNDFTSVGSTTVTFDGISASNIVIVDASTITCDSPAHSPGAVDVTVSNDFGSDTLTDGFSYNTQPSISSVAPQHGPSTGGTPVTISGNYFTTTPDTTVTFGGSPAVNVAVVNATTITCETPAHAAGAVNVTVTNANGSDTLPAGFTYHNAPSVSSVVPSTGSKTGGTSVTITGSDFTTVGSTAVTFDGIAASNIVILNSITITCTTPPHTVGPVDVTVTNNFGSDTLVGGFSYVEPPPEVLAISPEHGPIAGGTSVTILGNYFTTTPDTTVSFGTVYATNMLVVDDHTITCNAPAHAAGTVTVKVTNSNGAGSLIGGFTYHNPPVIAAINPDNGPSSGGTTVTVTGSEFTAVGSTSVTFAGAAATDVVVVDSTTITCTTPPGTAGPTDVTVANDFGSDTLVSGFTYNNSPVVMSVLPTDGHASGGTSVTITGDYFTTTPDTTVTFGGTAALNMVVVDVNTITCDTPAHTAGAVDVTVANTNGFGTLANGFTFHNAPTLTSVTPDNGTPAGGTPVTLSGADFTTVGSITVTFDGLAAANIVVVDAATITCETPPHAPGPVDVEVTTGFGSDTLAGGYTYNGAPSVSDVTPEHGSVAGGTSVTITGAEFTTTPDTTVTFAGVAAVNVAVVNATTITCDTPANAAGPADVTVANSNGSGTLPGGFTYHNSPIVSSLDPNAGPTVGGTPVTITGSEFSALGTTTVTFDGTVATNVVVVNNATITCTTPAHAAGLVDVVVTNGFGSGTLPNAYTYVAMPPEIQSIVPDHGPVSGGTLVTITGKFYTSSADTTVEFGTDPATDVTVVDSTTLTCVAPAHAAGFVAVTVTNSNGSVSKPNAYTYQNPPSIDSVTPDSGPSQGGTLVLIAGSTFFNVGTTTVLFDGVPATNVTVVNIFNITCVTPAGDPGPVNVTVMNDFGSDTLVNGFTYSSPPSITNVNPNVGLMAGGTPITITGQYFTNSVDTTVKIGGNEATDVLVLNSTTLTCKTPAHPIADKVDVEVKNSNGGAKKVNSFTYLPPTGAAPQNLTNVDTLNLYPQDIVLHCVTGKPGAMYILFFSLGPGPLQTPWGQAGLDVPVYYFFTSFLNANGYQTFPITMTDPAIGFFNFYTHCLVDDQPPKWATGGNNPNGTGSIKWGLHSSD